MKRTLTIIEDGTAVAAALATWLERKVGGAHRVTALDPADVEHVVAARQGISERVVTLTRFRIEGATLDGSAAMRRVTDWLADCDPFAARVVGPQRIEEHVRRGAQGVGPLVELARLASAEAIPSPKKHRRPRGRPRGSRKHFVGVELDVCIAMLVEPTRGWSERDLAGATGRSAYGVHRALKALEARGYLHRARGATTPQDAVVLRDDLARAWSREAKSRAAQWFVAPRRRSTVADAWSAAEAHGVQLILAGAAATDELTAGTTVVYADGDAEAALRAEQFVPSAVGRGQLVVWSTPTPMVFYAPRELGGRAATNRVVTYLDLVAGGTERHVAAAEALWAEP